MMLDNLQKTTTAYQLTPLHNNHLCFLKIIFETRLISVYSDVLRWVMKGHPAQKDCYSCLQIFCCETTTTTTILWLLYTSTCVSRHLQLRTGGFRWCKVFTGRMPFLPPNQQPQSTEGIWGYHLSVNMRTIGRGKPLCQNELNLFCRFNRIPEHNRTVTNRQPYYYYYYY